MSTQISPEWWDWIKISLDRGCSKESMIQVMMQNHFNQNEAENYIGEVSSGLISKEEKFPNLKKGAFHSRDHCKMGTRNFARQHAEFCQASNQKF